MDRIASYQAWLETHPGDRFALYSLALELERAGRLEEAESRLRALLTAHPLSGPGHYRLGLVLEALGRTDDARAAWEAGAAALAGATEADARRSAVEIARELDRLDDA